MMKRLHNRSTKIRLLSLLMIGLLSVASQDLIGAESSNLMEQARLKRAEGRNLEAIAIYRKLLKDNSSDSSRIHREIASIYKGIGEFKIAVEEYEKSITENVPIEGRVISHTEMGCLYYKMGDFARSIENYRKAIEYDRGDWKKHVRLGDIYREIDLYDRAIGEYQDAIKFNINSKEAYRGLASTYRDMGLYEESEQHLKKLLSIDSKDVEGYRELISIYEKMGKLDVATDSVLALIGFSSQAKNYRRLGFLYLERRMIDDAIESFEKACGIDPLSEDFHLDLGFAYFLKGYLEDAIEEFSAMIDQNNKRILPYFLRALSLYRLRKFQESRQDCERIKELNPQNRLGKYTQKLLDQLDELRLFNIE